MFWGLTPALNFLEEYKAANGKLPEELNILIIGGADMRHVLQTCARKYRHEKIKLNFYLMEACVETIAKQLLLIYIALQPEKRLGLDQKAKTFMELYGNTLVRPSVANYLSKSALQLIKMVTNYDYLQKKLNCVSFDIKYKERDYLENLLKFWCSKDDFNILDSWDRRLRKFLGVRYDSKTGAFDWDLHMRMHTVGGKQVCNQEYKSFRHNGVAFSWLESEVCKPNRSMVCATMPNGEKFIHCGYLGDMQTGPFVTFGLTCEDEEFLKSTNGQNSHRATDVTERNLKQIFHELEFQDEYEHKSVADYQLGSIVMKQDNLVVDCKAVELIRITKDEDCFNLEDVHVEFISISKLKLMNNKEKYCKKFDLIYFGAAYLDKHFDGDIIDFVSNDNCLLMMENVRFVLNNRNEQLNEFGEKLQKLVGTAKRFAKIDFNVLEDNYATFVRQ